VGMWVHVVVCKCRHVHRIILLVTSPTVGALRLARQKQTFEHVTYCFGARNGATGGIRQQVAVLVAVCAGGVRDRDPGCICHETAQDAFPTGEGRQRTLMHCTVRFRLVPNSYSHICVDSPLPLLYKKQSLRIAPPGNRVSG
jgi:hypothetical protein